MTFLPEIVMGDSGSPLINGITLLLLLECALIILFSLPFQMKFRRTFSEILVTSPNLKTVRTVFVTVWVILALMLLDNILRLARLQHRTAVDLYTAQQLHGQKARRQRDFFILSFTLFNAVALYQIVLLLLRMGRYRKERNAFEDQIKSLGAVPVEVLGLEGKAGGKVFTGRKKE
ncbi:hypothetical protein HDV00_002890 [Rhizophlyctis rosea]|nr:hypothetical protein HDV00_002890 [Rhizophlyctis rosea]